MDIALQVLPILIWPSVVLIIALVTMVMLRRPIIGLLHKTKTLEPWKLKIESLQEFVGPTTMDALRKNPDQLQPGGTRRRVTVLYAQLKGFSSISEDMSPEDVAEVSQNYLSAMTDIVFDLGGTLDRFAGYELTAYWGAPVAVPDAARRACTAALRMRDKVAALSDEEHVRNRPALRSRIVVTTGDMVVGDLGPRGRFRYSILGEAVDIVPRMVAAADEFGRSTVITEFTRDELAGNFDLVELGQVPVKGKNLNVRLYELTGSRVSASVPDR